MHARLNSEEFKDNHLSDIELIDFLGGHTPPERLEAVTGHLAECSQCRNRVDKLAETRDVLGLWEPEIPECDLSDSVVRMASRKTGRNLWTVLQVAAALLIAVGIGHVLGRWIKSDSAISTEDHGQQLVQANEQTVSEALFLEALDGNSRPGIAEAMLDLPLSSGEEN